MTIKVTVFSSNDGDGSSSVHFRRGEYTAEQLIEEEEEEGYDGYETYGHLEDPLDVLTFTDEDQMKLVLGGIVE